MALFKALFLGLILTLVVSALIHGAGYAGGVLMIQEVYIQGHYISWSWPLFIASTALAAGILALMA